MYPLPVWFFRKWLLRHTGTFAHTPTWTSLRVYNLVPSTEPGLNELLLNKSSLKESKQNANWGVCKSLSLSTPGDSPKSWCWYHIILNNFSPNLPHKCNPTAATAAPTDNLTLNCPSPGSLLESFPLLGCLPHILFPCWHLPILQGLTPCHLLCVASDWLSESESQNCFLSPLSSQQTLTTISYFIWALYQPLQ